MILLSCRVKQAELGLVKGCGRDVDGFKGRAGLDQGHAVSSLSGSAEEESI